MSNKIGNRGRLHRGAAGDANRHGVVRYRLKPLSPLVRSDGGEPSATAFAAVVSSGTMNLSDVAHAVAQRFGGLTEAGTIYTLQAVMEVLEEALREGRRVTLGGFLSFGVSLKGTVAPQRPADASALTLRPWVRCSQRFATAVNRGARLAPLPAEGEEEDASDLA